MFKSKLIKMAVIVFVSLALSGVANCAPRPEQANINWRQFEGSKLRVLFVAHMWQEAIEPYIKEFEQLTGIKVEVDVMAEDLYWTRITPALSAKSPPFDLFFTTEGYNTWSYFTNGWLEPLDKFMNNPQLTDSDWYDINDIPRPFQEGFVLPDPKGGNLFAIPITTEVYINYYRKDIFQERGIDVSGLKSIDAWLEVTRELNSELKPRIYGAAVRGGEVGILDELTAMTFNYWGDLPYVFGRCMYLDEKWYPRFTHPRIVEAFATWGELMKNSPPGVTAYTWYDVVKAFGQGIAATIWFDASLFAPQFENPEKSTVVGKVGYAVVPQTKYGHKTAFWTWGLGIPSRSPHGEAAWLFIQWATSKYMEERTVPVTAGPTRMSTLNSAEIMKRVPAGLPEVLEESFKIAEPSLLYLGAAEELTRGMLDALHFIYQGETPEKAMEKLQNKAVQILRQAGYVE